MDIARFDKIMNQVFLEVLEQYAFLMPEPLSLDQETNAAIFKEKSYLRIEMNMSGDILGKFIMLFPEEICLEIEQNLVGEDLAISADADGAKEILNIIGANVLNSFLGREAQFEISIPTAAKFNIQNWSKLSDLRCVSGFLVDNIPVYLFFDGAKSKDKKD